MLGSSGAGKTVYLASLYRKLGLAGDANYYIQPEKGKEIILTHLINKVVQPGSEWPVGTRKLDEWIFKCFVTNKSNKIEACHFAYIDYAGGTFTEASEGTLEEQNRLFEYESRADIILGLLDGQKILDYMQGSESRDVFNFKNLDIQRILQEMQHSSPTIPIHFIISKWDLVKNLGGFTLKEVRDKLLEIPEFHNFLKSRGNRATIRLIPVSAIGMTSASYERDKISGVIKTTKLGNEIEPFQVEIPLSYVLTDVVNKAVFELEKKKAELNGFKRITFIITSLFLDPLEELLPLGLNWLHKKTINLIVQQQTDKKIAVFDGELDDIKVKQEALLYLIDSFRLSIERFQDSNSGNLLN